MCQSDRTILLYYDRMARKCGLPSIKIDFILFSVKVHIEKLNIMANCSHEFVPTVRNPQITGFPDFFVFNY